MKAKLNRLAVDQKSLESILDFLPYPFLVSEIREGVHYNIFVNKKFSEEIGYTCQEMPTIHDWFHAAYPDPVYRQEIVEGWSARAKLAEREGQDHVVMKARIHTKTRGDVWYEVKASVFPTMNLVAFINIDEILKKEQQLNLLNENKNRTLSILSHDLRSPLSGLLSISQLAESSQLTTEELAGTLKSINKRTAQAITLLDHTLDWTKSNFENIQVRKEPVSLQEIVTTVLDTYEQTYLSKDIRITCVNLEKKVISSDPGILMILVRNIISNAIKYTRDHGEIRIAHSYHNGTDILSIADSGIGMSDELIASIGHSQSPRPGTHDEKGLGIGLKFCCELAEKISASIQFESRQGAGTTVRIIISGIQSRVRL